MPFTVEEFHDLVKLLEEQPEWRAELRRLVLTEELLALPELVRALTEAQRRTDEQIKELIEAQRRTDEQIKELIEAQRRIEEQIKELIEAQRRIEEQIKELIEAQRRTDEQIKELIEAQRRTDEQIKELIEAQRRIEERVDRMAIDLGELKGDALERRYRERAFAYFSPLVRQTHVVFGDELVALLEKAAAQGLLSEEEADDVSQADVLVRGRRREDSAPVYLVVEVSWGVGVSDVERARRRAAILAKAGTSTMPVVAGRWISQEAAEICRETKVWRLIDGRANPPDSP